MLVVSGVESLTSNEYVVRRCLGPSFPRQLLRSLGRCHRPDLDGDAVVVLKNDVDTRDAIVEKFAWTGDRRTSRVLQRYPSMTRCELPPTAFASFS